ncbi:MAG: ECF transporter S component [Oscillospiraceae bacterium]|nr:ECF transporter S component [Oscillospiraceae bacterium]
MKTRSQKLAVLAMLSALAYVLMFFLRIPVMPVPPYLKYDPKDTVIVIAGFLFGPLSSFAVSAVVSVIEMFTVSDTGYWGCLMNIVSTCSFACAAAAIYRQKRTLAGAAVGLAAGALLSTGVMLLWNYLVLPLYMGVPREFITGLLIPYFLPFNLLKNGLNAGFAVMLYRPVRLALGRTSLLPVSAGRKGRGISIPALAAAAFVVVTCILLAMAWNGVI